jgi:hypothetical protein
MNMSHSTQKTFRHLGHWRVILFPLVILLLNTWLPDEEALFLSYAEDVKTSWHPKHVSWQSPLLSFISNTTQLDFSSPSISSLLPALHSINNGTGNRWWCDRAMCEDELSCNEQTEHWNAAIFTKTMIYKTRKMWMLKNTVFYLLQLNF